MNLCLPRKFISMSSNIPNTAPYWSQAKKELDALCFFMLKEENVYPTYFDTSSCAEHQWEPLHKILAEYISNMVSESKEAILQKIKNDSKYRHQVLHENQHIVTSYFDTRHISYENTFLKEGLQFDDSWSRYEFAKSRGQIHSILILILI